MAAATLQRVMHRRSDASRTFHVSVVGLSGTERDKGQLGVGKSCLCNRFVRSSADDYHPEHISVLSQTDFGGRVVNNEHFMYWGDAAKVSEDGVPFHFQVVEQTEFIDDASFLPFQAGKMDQYVKRCTNTRLCSAEKLMYICKNQLGIEREYEQKVLPDGRFAVDGFLCVFDVSEVAGRPLSRQIEITMQILSSLLRTKKPVVLVTTKNDEARDAYVREAERLASRREFKGNIPLVETSAHQHANVDLAFITLAQLVDRGRGRIRLVPYAEAARLQRHLLAVLAESFQALVRAHVTDHRAGWSAAVQRLRGAPQFHEYVAQHGQEAAQRQFTRHVKRLRDEHVSRRVQRHVSGLPRALRALFADDQQCLVGCRWPDVCEYIRRHRLFERYFYELPEPDERRWLDETDERAESDVEPDARIPFHVLATDEAQTVFKNFLNAVQMQSKQYELRDQFKELLEDTSYVTPGKALSEVRVLFLGRECFEGLPEAERQHVYDVHQQQILEKARDHFQELLMERADMFCSMPIGMSTGSLTQDQMDQITQELQQDVRYRLLDRFSQDRSLLLLQHLAFLQLPRTDRCPAGPRCAELLTAQLLAARRAANSTSLTASGGSSHWVFGGASMDSVGALNVAIVGADSCADRLTKSLRLRCDEDELEIDGRIFSLNLRLINEDAKLTHSTFFSSDFTPHGCLCVYSSSSSLEYVRQSLERVLLVSIQEDSRAPLQGLPVVLVFTPTPAIDDAELGQLQREGAALADSLQCPFVDCSCLPSALTASGGTNGGMLAGRRGSCRDTGGTTSGGSGGTMDEDDDLEDEEDEQVADMEDDSTGDATTPPDEDRLMCSLSALLQQRGETAAEDSVQLASPTAAVVSHQRAVYKPPDVRIMMCLFCGDPYSAESVVGAILSNRNCSTGQDNSILIDVFLGECQRRVEVILCSYHGVSAYRDHVVHGLILVYSAKRRASLSNLSVLASTVPHLPVQILAVTDAGGANALFGSQLTHELITEGNALADRLQAHFMTSTSTCQQKSAFYLSFFREVWERRSDTERALELERLHIGDPHTPPTLLMSTSAAATHQLSSDERSGGSGIYGRQLTDTSLAGEPPLSPLGSQHQLHVQLQQLVLTDDSNEVPLEEAPAAPGHQRQAHRQSSRHHQHTNGESTGTAARRSLQHELFGRQCQFPSTESLPSCLGQRSARQPPFCRSRTEHPGSIAAAAGEPSAGTDSQHHRRARKHRAQQHSQTAARTDGLSVFPAPSTPPEPAPDGRHNRHQLPECSAARHQLPPLSSPDLPEQAVSSDWLTRGVNRRNDDLMTSPSTIGSRNPTAAVSSKHTRPVKSPSSSLANQPGRLNLSQYADVADALDKLNLDPGRAAVLTSRCQQQGGGSSSAASSHMLASEYAQVKDALYTREYSYTLAQDAAVHSAKARLRQRTEQGRLYATDSDSECSGGGAEVSGGAAVVVGGSGIPPRRTPPKRCRKKKGAIPVAVPRVPSQETTNPITSNTGVSDSDGGVAGSAAEHDEDHTASISRHAFGVGSVRVRNRNRRGVPASVPVVPASAAGDAGPEQVNSRLVQQPATVVALDGCREDAGKLHDHSLSTSAVADLPLRSVSSKEEKARRKDKQRQVKDEEKRRVKEEEKQRKLEKERLKKEKSSKKRKSPASASQSQMEDRLPTDGQLPGLLARCVQLIEADGLDTEGLYRVPGNRAHVDLLFDRLSEDSGADVAGLDIAVNAVATALKDYISKKLPPLVPHDKLADLTNIAGVTDRRTRLFRLRVLLKELPPPNFNILKFIFQHFIRVTERARYNSMDSKNLAICWWPTLIPLQFTDMCVFESMRPHLEDMVQTMIDQFPYLFEDKEERMMV